MRRKRSPGEIADAKRLGRRIATLREERGIATQRELAKRIGVDPSTIYRLESGLVTCSTQTIRALCRVLRCSFETLTTPKATRR
jgi:DNA-binding XRE family transcriptional regulator